MAHMYLVGVMSLAAIEVVARRSETWRHDLRRIGIRTLVAMALAWPVAIALWPWLQDGNPFTQFTTALFHFATFKNSFPFMHWGEQVTTDALPWSYIPMQFAARLPELFLLLLALAAGIGITAAVLFLRRTVQHIGGHGAEGWRAPAVMLAQSRNVLLLVAAIVLPIASIMILGTTLYDGVRHLMFIIPVMALLAAGAVLYVWPALLRRRAVALAVIAAAGIHVGATAVTLVRLHPLEYVNMNALAGGVAGAYGRFDLDYWGAAATTALRDLEKRLDQDISGRFMHSPPRITVCIPWMESRIKPLLRRDWIVETTPRDADFMIGTERNNCGQDFATLIGEVKRLDRTFAWTYAHNRGRID
jgi:hypothetical protein